MAPRKEISIPARLLIEEATHVGGAAQNDQSTTGAVAFEAFQNAWPRVARETPQPKEKLGRDAVGATLGEVGSLIPAMPPCAPQNAGNAAPTGQIEKDDRVGASEADLHRPAVVAVDDPAVGGGKLFDPPRPLLGWRGLPARAPEVKVQMDDRQPCPLAELARQGRLARSSAAHDRHALHAGILVGWERANTRLKTRARAKIDSADFSCPAIEFATLDRESSLFHVLTSSQWGRAGECGPPQRSR